MDSALPFPGHSLKVCQRRSTTGVGNRDRRPFPKSGHQSCVDSTAEPLDIDGMDQEFRTGTGQLLQVGRSDLDLCEVLPPIRHHEILSGSHTAAKVQDQTISSDCAYQLLKASTVEL